MKTVSHFIAMLAVAMSSVSAYAYYDQPISSVISDPEDHVFYDTQLLGPQRTWTAPDFFVPSEWLPNASDAKLGKGWGFGDTKTGSAFNTRANMREWCGIEEGDEIYGIILEVNGQIRLDLPSCDSIYVRWMGTGQRGIKITNTYNDEYGWYALEGNRPGGETGLTIGSKDSVTVFLNPTKLDKDVLPTGQTFIMRIKIYEGYEKGELPEFDGTVAAWSDRYRPGPTGTVVLDHMLQTTDEETARYAKYASDLGIRRVMMSTSRANGMLVRYNADYEEFVTTIDGLVADKVDAEGFAVKTKTYADGTQHQNYLQLDGKTNGCQEMSLSFDFVIEKGNENPEYLDSLVVVAQYKDDRWVELGYYPIEFVDEKPVLRHVSVALPDSLFANKEFCLRLMPAYLEQTGAALHVANLSLNGFDDYHAKDSKAKTVGYITSATDRIHILDRSANADSTDNFLRTLMNSKNYKVKLFTQAETAGLDSPEAIREAFKDCDAVILGESVPSSDAVAKNAVHLIGYKPFLNMKAYAAKNWPGSLTPSNGQADSLLTLSSTFMVHPIFNGLKLKELSVGNMQSPSLFKSPSNGEKYFQSVNYVETDSSYVIARGVNSGEVCLYEDFTNPAAIYLMLPISATQYGNVNSDGVKMFTNALSYILTGDYFKAPKFMLTTTGANVGNTAELKAALAYNFSVLNVSKPVFKLSPSTDPDGLYQLDSIDNLNKGALVIEANGNQPVKLAGSLKLDEFTATELIFDNLVFVGGETPATLFQYVSASHKLDALQLQNCRLEGVNSLFANTGANKSSLKLLKLDNCWIDGQGQPAAGAFISLDDAISFALDSICFSENVFENCTAPTMVSLRGTYSGSAKAVAFYASHNVFYQSEAPEELTFFSSKMNNFKKASHFNLTDNIFFNMGQAAIEIEGGSAASYAKASYNLFMGESPDWYEVLDISNAVTSKSLNIKSLFADGKVSLDKTSPLYIAGSKRSYLGALQAYAARTEARRVRVSSVDELKTAIEIAIGGDVIEMETEPSDEGVYLLGSTGFSYPRIEGKLTICAAEGESPDVFGRLSNNRASYIDTLLIEGINWVSSTDYTGYDLEAYQPFLCDMANDTVKVFLLRNCQFSNQQNQVMFRTRNTAKGSYYGKLDIENCRFENNGGSLASGKMGAHLFQFDAADTYTLNHFHFCNNVVSNFHGSQLFNIARSGAPEEADSVYTIDICHNLFYKLGGNAADQLRNFLEFNKRPEGATRVDIAIADNIFYRRWSSQYYPVAKLALYDDDDEIQTHVLISNNFYDGQYYTGGTTYTANPVGRTDYAENFYVTTPSSDSIQIAHVSDMFKSSFEGMEEVFYNEKVLSIKMSSPLYTAGRDGSCLGPDYLYVQVDALKALNAEASLKVMVSAEGQIWVNCPADGSLEIFDLMGRRLQSLDVQAGLVRLENLPASSLYLIRQGAECVKLSF